MEEPGFWDNASKAQENMKELKALESVVDGYDSLKNRFDDIQTLIEMGYEDEDDSLIPEIEEELDTFIHDYDELRISTLLSGEYDADNAILTLHAGAGGTESCDWAGMLARMYQRWADKKGYSVEILDSLDGDEAGIKSITMQINGTDAYGYLKSEKGYTGL